MPVVANIPAPTTLAILSAVRLNTPSAEESSRLRSVFDWVTIASKAVERPLSRPAMAGILSRRDVAGN